MRFMPSLTTCENESPHLGLFCNAFNFFVPVLCIFIFLKTSEPESFFSPLSILLNTFDLCILLYYKDVRGISHKFMLVTAAVLYHKFVRKGEHLIYFRGESP